MRRLMLVDDEANVLNSLRRTLNRALADCHVQIETFDDPRQALERALEADFAVVISDYRMPPMDGVTFLQQFRITQPDAKRLILSASSDAEALLGAINQAAILRYVMKPWDDVDLAIIVRDALDQYAEEENARRLASTVCGEALSTPEEQERARLEAEEPGITQVRWGADGSVLLEPDGDKS